MRRKLVIVPVVALIVTCGSMVAAAAVGPFVTHDNWASRQIRSTHWRGLVPFAGTDTGLESGRAVTLSPAGVPELNMNLRQATAPGDDFRGALNVLEIADPSAVAAIEATYSVRSLTVREGCTSPDGFAEADALLTLALFADDSVKSGPGDRTGDHVAIFGAARNTEHTDSARTLHLGAFVGRCLNPACSMFDEVAEVLVGTARRGSRIRASLTWDPDNDTFLVKVNNNAPVDLSYGPGTMVESPPGRRFAGIGQFVSAGLCATGTSASIKTVFGTIRTAPLVP